MQQEDAAVGEALLDRTTTKTSNSALFNSFRSDVLLLLVLRFSTQIQLQLCDNCRVRTAQTVESEDVTSKSKRE